MTQTIKKASIAIMVTIFIAAICLSMTILPSKAYADMTYAIGDNGPAGGIIFYKASDGAGGWNYLEVAPSNQSNGAKWSNTNDSVPGGTGTGIGTGEANTAAILLQDNTAPAAKLCRDYNGGGFTDWFLPSIDELQAIWWNLVSDHSADNAGRGKPYAGSLGGFAGVSYWSSSQDDALSGNARVRDMGTGSEGTISKSLPAVYVRAIRAFTVPATETATGSVAATYVEPVWMRDHEMTCWQVWINQDNDFEFIFFWEYANNNWVKIYDMAGNEVFSIDMLHGNPKFEADLPDGFYTVKSFHNGFETPIQEFLIGKP